jgi:hypothetical protein
VKAIVVDCCAGETSDARLSTFHVDMYHGIVMDYRGLPGTLGGMFRNVYVEPSVTCPLFELHVDVDLWRRLSPHVPRALGRAVYDEFVYSLPWQLGEIPAGYDDWFGERIRRRDAATLSRLVPGRPTRAYLCLDYASTQDVWVRRIHPPGEGLLTVRARNLRQDYLVDGALIVDSELLRYYGIVRTEFGLQLSRNVFDVLCPFLTPPYFRTAEIEVEQAAELLRTRASRRPLDAGDNAGTAGE